MQLTEHFSDEELGVAGCNGRFVANAVNICQQLLEPIRLHFGPVRVHDGYRDPGHNARVGGKAMSFHLFQGGAAAADIDVPGVDLATLFDWIRLESGLPFDKVIFEVNSDGSPACVHLQITSDAPPRRLAYTGQAGAGTVYVPVQVK